MRHRKNNRHAWSRRPTVFTVVLLLGLSVRVGSAADPIVECRDVSEVKLSLEREPVQGNFGLTSDVRRLVDTSLGVDGDAVLANLNAIVTHLNSDPDKFGKFARFHAIGDVVGGIGPIFLIGDSCVGLCSAFEFQKAGGVFSWQSIQVGRRYLSIQSRDEDAGQFKIILANQQGLASLDFTQKENVVGETLRFREYRAFGKASAWPGDRCLKRE